jgi:hypothetical protein
MSGRDQKDAMLQAPQLQSKTHMVANQQLTMAAACDVAGTIVMIVKYSVSTSCWSRVLLLSNAG